MCRTIHARALAPAGAGYYPRYLTLEREILALAPSVDVSGDMGRTSSFEVTVDRKYLAHSKLRAGGTFPDMKRLASEIAEYARSGKVPAGWTSE